MLIDDVEVADPCGEVRRDSMPDMPTSHDGRGSGLPFLLNTLSFRIKTSDKLLSTVTTLCLIIPHIFLFSPSSSNLQLS